MSDSTKRVLEDERDKGIAKRLRSDDPPRDPPKETTLTYANEYNYNNINNTTVGTSSNLKQEPTTYSTYNTNTFNTNLANYNNISSTYTTTSFNQPSTTTKKNETDTSKLNDAIAAAGVDIQKEEELLKSYTTYNNHSYINRVKAKPFLEPYHVSSFMSKVAHANGIQQHFINDPDLLDLVSSACEQWISSILTKTIILSKHRRRNKSVPLKSDLSKELKNLAQKQKDLEEKRVNKRILLGLEKNDQPEEVKHGAEETLHRAANATAAMMSSGKKKYSWMNASSTPETVIKTVDKGKPSSIISSRGDNGLRLREIRPGDTVNMKDLLTAIEGERIGTTKAVVKGYAKLRE